MIVLLDLAARGALLLAATGVAALLLRRASAAVLCLLWSSAAVALLALPAVGLLAPAWELPVPADWLPVVGAVGGDDPAATTSAPAAVKSVPREVPHAVVGRRVESSSSAPAAAASPVVDGADPASEPPASTVAGSVSPENSAPGPGRDGHAAPARASVPGLALARLVPALWLAGSLLLIGRTLTSLVRGARVVAAAHPVAEPGLEARVRRLADRLDIRGDVRLLETDAVRVPLVWHLGRPCLLVPGTLLSWPSRRQESVILHELAHVKRQDCRTWLLARLAVALHWFNPLAWVALAEIRAHRERACDDAVLRAGVRPSSYARHLVSVARSLQGRPVAFAGGAALLRETGFSTRVRAILDPRTGRTSPNRRTVVTLVACILSLLIPVAAIHPVAAQAPTPPPPVQGPEEPETADPPWIPVSEEFFPGALPAEPAPVATPAAQPPDAEAPAAATRPVGAAPASPQEPDPDLDALVRMRIHGVTPEFIDAMAARLGRAPSTEELVKLRIHDVDPGFVDEMRELLDESLDVEDIVRLSIHDVDPELARQMRAVLGESLDAETLIRLSIHDVEPALARTMKELFGAEVDAESLTSVSIHDVTPEFARAMRDAFGADLGIQELVKARIHDVAPADATELGELLGAELDLDDVVRLHIQDVAPDFVRAMRELLPAEDLDVDKLLKLRIHDVSPELVRRLREAGYDDLDADELVRIQIHDLAEVMLRRNGGGS